MYVHKSSLLSSNVVGFVGRIEYLVLPAAPAPAGEQGEGDQEGDEEVEYELGEGEEEGDEVGWGTVGTYLRP
jgi:hypothetical protein